MVKKYNAYNRVRVDKLIKSGHTIEFAFESDAKLYADSKRCYRYPIYDEKGNWSYGVPK